MRYNIRHIFVDWIIISFFIAIIISIICKLTLSFFLKDISVRFLASILSFLWIMIFFIFFVTQRSVKYIQLLPTEVIIKHYNNSREVHINLKDLESIEYAAITDNRFNIYYTLNLTNEKKIIIPPRIAPLSVFKEYCEKHSIILKLEKQKVF